MELEKHITDEKTGISYTLCGDYYLPDLKLPEEKSYDLGRFGRAKLRHLRKCHAVKKSPHRRIPPMRRSLRLFAEQVAVRSRSG